MLQRSISKVSPNSAVRVLLEVLFLLALGALAAILHSKLKIPLQLPGRQGMLFMALLILGRMSSNLSPAAFISCLGSSAIMMGGVFSFGDPFTPLIYPVLGLVLDIVFRMVSNNKYNILIISIIAGFAWMMIPASRLIISLFTSFPFHSFRYGPLIPFLTHLIFGFTGGILGYSISRIIDRSSAR
ncbi:MAG: hypothetical protein AB9842_13990 [Bacteroidales bacterium]